MTDQPLDPAAQLIESIRVTQDGLAECWETLRSVPGYPIDATLAANVKSLAAALTAEREQVQRARIALSQHSLDPWLLIRSASAALSSGETNAR